MNQRTLSVRGSYKHQRRKNGADSFFGSLFAARTVKQTFHTHQINLHRFSGVLSPKSEEGVVLPKHLSLHPHLGFIVRPNIAPDSIFVRNDQMR